MTEHIEFRAPYDKDPRLTDVKPEIAYALDETLVELGVEPVELLQERYEVKQEDNPKTELPTAE